MRLKKKKKILFKKVAFYFQYIHEYIGDSSIEKRTIRHRTWLTETLQLQGSDNICTMTKP